VAGDDFDPVEATGDFTIGVGENVDLPILQLPPDESDGGEPAAESAGGVSPPPPAGEPERIGVPDWAIEAATHAIFAYVANSRGEHWVITDEEASAIAIPLAAELTDLMQSIGIGVPGDGLGFLTARRLEIAGALAAAIVPRYMRDMEIRKLAGAVAGPAPDGPEVLHGDVPSGHREPGEVATNGYDPDAPGSMADALAAKQANTNGVSE